MKDIWVVPTVGLLRIVLLWTFVYKFRWDDVLSFLLGTYLGVELLGQRFTLGLTFGGTVDCFQIGFSCGGGGGSFWGVYASPPPHSPFRPTSMIFIILKAHLKSHLL